VNYPGSGSLSPELLSQEQGSRESSIQTLAFGMGGDTKLFDLLAIKYDFDYSRLHYGRDRNFINPSLEILVTPSAGLSVKTSFLSRRVSEADSVKLPDGELLNLSEPTLVTMVGDQVSMSQFRHSEVAIQKTLMPDTTLEVAVYQNNTQGPGLPLMVTTITPTERTSKVIQLNEDRSGQRGMRVTVNRKLFDFLSGSCAYVYGAATSISNVDEPISSDRLSDSLVKNARRRYLHSVTGQLDATVPITGTNLLATVRWYAGNPMTPIDWFSDRLDIGGKSVNFEIRQAIPMPEFWGNTGRWEVLVDLRNLLDQGREVVSATDGELVLNRNPRSLRFGLSLNFR
jgi:hypothetical protein